MTTESIISFLRVEKIVHNHVAVMAVLTGVICAINDWELINPLFLFLLLKFKCSVLINDYLVWVRDCEGETNALQDFANLT